MLHGGEAKHPFDVSIFRPNSFVIITANRVIHCNTETPEEMHHWIGLLQKSKGDARVDGQEFLVRGQLSHTQSFVKLIRNLFMCIHVCSCSSTDDYLKELTI